MTALLLAVAQQVDCAALARELHDLERLARLAEPAYTALQFSSYDRRSQAPDRPGWFSNADGFGGEPIPGFAAVLRAPEGERPGLYLLCDETGPGALVRSWSAGMGGTLRVYLDGQENPLYEGDAYRFLARRSEHFGLRAGDAFVQQDADYLPLPYAEGLRVTWEGALADLHFYHLQVRRYAPGTALASFDPARDLAPERWEAAVARLRAPRAPVTDYAHRWSQAVAPRETLTITPPEAAPAVVRGLELQLQAPDLPAALRSLVLRIWFDGAPAPQVEAPVGDFFAAGPGIAPLQSLPFSVQADGRLQCRFVMPYERALRLAFENTGAQAVTVRGELALAPWDWDDRSLHFHARWRAEHDLVLAEGERRDLAFLHVQGRGRLVGTAVQLVNPAPCPHPAGSWWGEGDEKIFVDGAAFPAFFGTGSEDYFNYSWSRPDLFDHSFCGQPLNSGPGNAGYVSNYRFHVLDDVPFRSELVFSMELWPHTAGYPISYARTVYWYARPGGRELGPPLAAADCRVPALEPWEPRPIGGASGAQFFYFADATPAPETRPEPLASRGRVLDWAARPGETRRLRLSVPADGGYRLHLVARHAPDGGALALQLAGHELVLDDAGGGGQATGGREVSLRLAHGTRLLSLGFAPVPLSAGTHELQVGCAVAGVLGLEYVWIRPQ